MAADYRLFLFLIIILSINTDEAKIFTKCPLAKELDKSGINRSFIANWICLAQAESGLDSQKTTQIAVGSMSYGIFQINNKTGCREGRKGGICNMKCEGDSKVANYLFLGFHSK